MSKTYSGIDVSENNGTLDWKKIKAAGVEFAIIRCGYGKSHVDTQFKRNVEGAKEQGIPYGVYHYSYALDAAGAKKEAALVLSLLDGLNLATPVWFDMEDADSYKGKRMKITKTAITEICQGFCESIRAKGYEVGVYASKYWFETYIDTSKLGKCSFWLAQWAKSPSWSGSYTLWQNSGKGRISGLAGYFDTDVAYSLKLARSVTAMQKDVSCTSGVYRLVGTATTLYGDAQLTSARLALKAGDYVIYYGNYCTIDGEKYAYVSATGASGYVKATCLRMPKAKT